MISERKKPEKDFSPNELFEWRCRRNRVLSKGSTPTNDLEAKRVIAIAHLEDTNTGNSFLSTDALSFQIYRLFPIYFGISIAFFFVKPLNDRIYVYSL